VRQKPIAKYGIRYLGGWLGEDPSSLVSFCIGPMSRIIEKRDIVFEVESATLPNQRMHPTAAGPDLVVA
jgi:hypothetical protein